MPGQPRFDKPGAPHRVMGRGVGVGRSLGINTYAVNRLAVSYELQEVEKFS